MACLLMTAGAAGAGEQASSVGSAQRNNVGEMCKVTICQHNLHVVLKQKDGTVFDRTFDVMPGAVEPHWLVIIAGQTLNIEADRVGSGLTNFKVVDSVQHPEKTLTLSLEQTADGTMLLKLSNPYNQPLKFDMGMMRLDDERLLKTSSCPVMAGGSSFETWQEPIFQVVLANARFLDKGSAGSVCS
ncbi:hypothetical protein [Dyella agri]|uniref:Uncharacterized protein n=1 Tax=Dyella agri TaxID=1926869 RepID=A0ABW8KK80_9GAMM